MYTFVGRRAQKTSKNLLGTPSFSHIEKTSKKLAKNLPKR
jgi:hypothetical protein